MQELIKITVNENGKRTVSAKDLHKALEVKETFSDWFSRMVSYGLEQDIDYEALTVFMPHGKSPGGVYKKEYILTIDGAKEVCMVQRTPLGKKFRTYFIECEKIAKLVIPPPVPTLTPLEYAKALVAAEEKALEYQQQLAAAAPKLEYHDKVLATKNGFPITHIASELDMSAIELNKQLHFKGVQHKVGRTWILNAKYQNKGYTQVVTHTYEGSEGNTKTSHLTVWTEEGRRFIHSFFK